ILYAVKNVKIAIKDKVRHIGGQFTVEPRNVIGHVNFTSSSANIVNQKTVTHAKNGPLIYDFEMKQVGYDRELNYKVLHIKKVAPESSLIFETTIGCARFYNHYWNNDKYMACNDAATYINNMFESTFENKITERLQSLSSVVYF